MRYGPAHQTNLAANNREVSFDSLALLVHYDEMKGNDMLYYERIAY